MGGVLCKLLSYSDCGGSGWGVIWVAGIVVVTKVHFFIVSLMYSSASESGSVFSWLEVEHRYNDADSLPLRHGFEDQFATFK